MRAIDTILVRMAIREDWIGNASDKAEALQKLHDRISRRYAADHKTWRRYLSKAVERMAPVWQDKALKQVLMDASFGKCWYCEANVEQRADNAVDHFRPKNRVAEDKTHPGYWWLACDWHNYRFACGFCNSVRNTPESSGGKQDCFPLWDETKRVRTPKKPLIDEQPKLLDPTNPADTACLSFEASGKPVARYSREQSLYKYERAGESIRRYHLDRSKLNESRRKLMASIDEKLTNAEQFLRKLDPPDPTAEAGYQMAFAALVELIRPQAEFSSAARAFIGAKRGTSSVARDLFEIPL